MTVKERIEQQVEEAEAHWPHILPLLSEITDEADYDRRVAMMDHLLDRGGDLENDPRAELVSRIGDLIEAYDERNRPMPEPEGREVLRYLMAEHGLTQSDLPEVGGAVCGFRNTFRQTGSQLAPGSGFGRPLRGAHRCFPRGLGRRLAVLGGPH